MAELRPWTGPRHVACGSPRGPTFPNLWISIIVASVYGSRSLSLSFACRSLPPRTSKISRLTFFWT